MGRSGASARHMAPAISVATPHLSSVRHPGGSFNGSKRASLRRVAPRASMSAAFWDTESHHRNVRGTRPEKVSPSEKDVCSSISSVTVLFDTVNQQPDR